MNGNPFYNQFFNQQYVNPDYYRQSQEQIIQYQQEQSKEVQNVVKTAMDWSRGRPRMESACATYKQN